MAKLDRRKVLSYRYQVNGLQGRLPEGDLAAAAHSGLQDSAPRAGVMSLHARVESVEADSWTSRELVQVWGPRGAVYVVPKADLATFTFGLMPRDPDRVADLEKKAKQVLRVLNGRPQRHSAVLKRTPTVGEIRELLWVSTTGRFLPFWDASTTALYPADPPEGDPEEARLDLARRFLHYLGPTTTKALQWWTDSSAEDASKTMAALGPELGTVEVAGEEVLMLAADIDRAMIATPPEGLHLLPPDDVYISRLAGPLLVPDGGLYSRLYPKAPNPGALVVDGEVVATWRRRDRRITMIPFPGVKTGDLSDRV
ncbi:MAG: hypothetical protein HKN91_13400, partial [Acidimicrobiia bacterium]|nr:hypothetical protein [Acidimicrobiia bacterium]